MTGLAAGYAAVALPILSQAPDPPHCDSVIVFAMKLLNVRRHLVLIYVCGMLLATPAPERRSSASGGGSCLHI